MKTILMFLAAFVAAPLTANAQSINPYKLDDTTHVATLTAGAEHGLSLGVGYGRILSIADRPVLVGGDLTLGWAEVDLSDYRVRASAFAPIVGDGGWKVLGGITTTVRGTENAIAQMTNVGADVAIHAGRYARYGFVAAELGFDWAAATHVEHAAIYRMAGYADAEDGWYGNAGGMFRVGLEAGMSMGPYDVILRAGRLADVAGNPAKFPFYGTLSFDRRW